MQEKTDWPSASHKMKQESPVKFLVSLAGESRFVDVGGIRTHYLVTGEGSPLLLVHGLGASVATWRDNIAALSRKFRVYAIDLPGHGDSDKPINLDYRMETMSEYIIKFLDALNLEKVFLIGNSAGGSLALQVALDHPDRVTKLVLSDIAGLGRNVSIYIRLVTLPFLGNILESSKVGGTRFMLFNVFYNKMFVENGLLQEFYRSRQMKGAKEAVVRTIRNGVNVFGIKKHFMFLPKLKTMKLPVLLVWGAQDLIFPAVQAYEAAKTAPNILLKVFDQCGHWPHMEKSAEFNQLVEQFFEA